MAIKFNKAQDKPEDSLLAVMDVDIAVNDKGDVMVLHGKEFESAVLHIDYYAETGDLVFFEENGKATPLGMPAPESTREKIRKAVNASLLLMNEEHKIAGFKTVPIKQN